MHTTTYITLAEALLLHDKTTALARWIHAILGLRQASQGEVQTKSESWPSVGSLRARGTHPCL